MVWCCRSKKEHDEPIESARDVRREYAARIEQFLSEVSPRSWPGHNKRSLSELFQFARDAHQTKSDLQAEVADLHTRLTSSQNQASSLRGQLAEAQGSLREQAAALSDRDADIASADHRWGEILAEANRRHEQEVAEVNNRHEQGVADLEAQHTAVVAELRDRIDRLIGELMHNQPAESRAWTDEKLKGRMKDLDRLVSEITKPQQGRSGPIIASTFQDTDGFLAREGTGSLSFLLGSMMWDILAEHFFSLPLGFGALGPGQGKEALLGVYKAWRVLVNATGNEEYEESFVAIFTEDPEANKWRSATFESLMASVLQKDRSSLETPTARSSSVSRLLSLYGTNIKKAAGGMEKVLADVTGRECATTVKSRREMILKAARLAAELGLQLGVQCARVELKRPARNQSVVIGDEFHHCMDGDLDRGQRVRVDLVVSPGLTRLGSAKTDDKPVVHCNIYPYPTH
ncbi:hypothetical protein V8F06_012959 [Rhypophila decipiens]